MKITQAVLFLWLIAPVTLGAQYPMGTEDGREYGRDGQRNPDVLPRETPVITRVELDGPLQPPDFQKTFALTDEQLRAYAAVYDSFTVETNEPRTAALRRVEQLGQAIGRDSAAVEYYKGHLKELGKTLRSAQSRFDDRLKRFLTKEQQKQYKDWRKRDDDAAKEAALGRRAVGRVPS